MKHIPVYSSIILSSFLACTNAKVETNAATQTAPEVPKVKKMDGIRIDSV